MEMSFMPPWGPWKEKKYRFCFGIDILNFYEVAAYAVLTD